GGLRGNGPKVFVFMKRREGTSAMPQSDLSSPWITGRLLVATPAMPDPRFAQSVIFMCRHGPEGALGLIVNKPIDDLPLSEILQQLDIPVSLSLQHGPVHYGGPVETQRGLVLHSPDYRREETMLVDDRHALTASLEILRDIASGAESRRHCFCLFPRQSAGRHV